MWVPIDIPSYIARLSGKLVGGFSRKQINQVALYNFYRLEIDQKKTTVREFILTKDCEKVMKKLNPEKQ